MNSPQPTSPILENQALAADLSTLNSADQLAAKTALSALAKEAEPPAEETPPLPDHLKNRWREKFGREMTLATPSMSFSQRLSQFLFGSTFARMGMALGCLALGFFVVQSMHSEDPGATISTDSRPVTLRNGQTPTTPTAATTPLLLVADDAGKAFAVEWSGAAAQVFASEEAALQAAAAMPHAVLANQMTAKVSVLAAGKIERNIPLDTLSSVPAEMAISVQKAFDSMAQP